MKSNDILYIPDSKGLKVLATRRGSGHQHRQLRRHLSGRTKRSQAFAECGSEGVNGRAIQNRAKSFATGNPAKH